MRWLAATRKRPRMPRTRSPPSRIRDLPRRTAAPTYPRRHGPDPVLPHDTGSAASDPARRFAPAGVPAGQGPARWEVVLRLRASAVLPGWPLGKVNSNLACSGIPSPPGTPSPGPSAAWPCWIAATPASWRIRPCEGPRPIGANLPVPPTVPSQQSDRPPVAADPLYRLLPAPTAKHLCPNPGKRGWREAGRVRRLGRIRRRCAWRLAGVVCRSSG